MIFKPTPEMPEADLTYYF